MTNENINLRDLTEKDLDITIWRYMTFSKFISLLTYQALWFSKLNKLEDGLEGTIPFSTKQKMDRENQKWKHIFNKPYLHQQIDNWNDKNEEDGRNLIIANCWFIGETESEIMCKDYASKTEGVAIKSTPKNLLKSVRLICDKNISHIGRIKYVSHSSHEMNRYHANQAIERAFIKDERKFGHESELRLGTFNFITPNCVRSDGVQYTREEVSRSGMNEFENPGLYIGVLIDSLFNEVAVSPQSSDYFYKLVKRLIELYKIKVNVSRSSLLIE